jgi:hypothetical protein
MGQNARQTACNNFNKNLMLANYAAFFAETAQDAKQYTLDPIPENLLVPMDPLFEHCVSSIIDKNTVFRISNYGNKLLSKQEPLFVFERHVQLFSKIPFILKTLQEGPTNFPEALNPTDRAKLNASLLYLIKHDFIEILPTD